jgi:hypothetical protein
MKTQTRQVKSRKQAKKRFSWVVSAADRRARARLPSGNCGK